MAQLIAIKQHSMKHSKQLFLLITVLFFVSCITVSRQTKTEDINPSLVLWYDKPAAEWTEALPVGNGKIGAMIFGKTENETIQFNEETVWSGQPHDYANKGAHNYLEEIRNLLWKGRQNEAHKLANEKFMSQPFGQLSYLPFGNILLSFRGHDNAENYSRKLDLENAVSSVFYEIDGIQFKREIIASAPGQILAIRLEASKNGALNFTAGLDSPHSD